ncbi:MAG TPA: SBBP repeat-containing protein [Bryobacteraceae bacterium]|nr:SBBP repeat-containing protein [Bryobacteraceae bacterium]
MRLIFSFIILTSSVFGGTFTTYIGGVNQDQGGNIAALATDAAGDTYITGSNGFVTKLDPAGNIVYTITFAGQLSSSNAIAADPAGNVWMGGNTSATNFPLLNALQSVPSQSATGPLAPGSGSGFLVKMASDGTILYSSYFGGVLGATNVAAIAFDQNGNVYVTGITSASDFPKTAGLTASPVNASGPDAVSGAFVTKLDPTGQKIIYSTVVAGNTPDCTEGSVCTGRVTAGAGIAVDGTGNAWVAGNSGTSDLPVTTDSPRGSGAFLLRVNAAGNEMAYLSYIGPAEGFTSHDIWASTTLGARPIAVDSSGNVYLGGSTSSPNFLTTPGAYQTTFILNGSTTNSDAFVMKLDPSGATVWATFVGGAFGSAANAISLDSSDNVWLTGSTGAIIPNTANPAVEYLTFVAELSADASSLPNAANFPPGEAGQDLAVDAAGVVHFAGSGTGNLVSTITPGNSPNRVLSILNAAAQTFAAVPPTGLVAPGEIITLYGSGLGPTTSVAASPHDGFFPTSLGGVQVLVDGVPIPLLYVSASQINAEIPSPIDWLVSGIADVRVVNNGTQLPDFRVAATASVFAAFTNGPPLQLPNTGAALVAINQDGTVNSSTNPAKAGSYVSIWATGFGSVPGVTIEGSVAAAASNYCSSCQVTLNGSGPETVAYAGPSPGLIDGLMQINFIIPAEVNSLNPQLQVSFIVPGDTAPTSLGFVWVAP